ncbi:AlpA family transcriptional regulator [Vibrio scophthalmi]|uniref:helix-turn-helix transcriptional regulator n=1 Tax=Vibrio scophthalmi TaxID=45658 RepID=UPI003AABC6D2
MPDKEIRLIRLQEVQAMTGLSRSSMYRFIERDEFPSQFSLGDRAVAWVESEVRDWIANRIESRNFH